MYSYKSADYGIVYHASDGNANQAKEQVVMDAEKLKQRLLVKPAEAASMLAISRSSVYELLRDGTIPCVRVAGMLRISVEELKKIASQGAVLAD